jgi:hypothetical protein
MASVLVNPAAWAPTPTNPRLQRNKPMFAAPANSTPLEDQDPETSPDRRRAVRLAWEKLVRWSRSWRSKAKTDVLERTKKVFFLYLSYFTAKIVSFLTYLHHPTTTNVSFSCFNLKSMYLFQSTLYILYVN